MQRPTKSCFPSENIWWFPFAALWAINSGVFSLPRPHVNKRMEKLTEDRGLLLRSPASKVGLGVDAVKLTAEETSALTTISESAENLDWFRAKSAWEACKSFKAPLCNAAMHAAFRCGNYKYGAQVYADMCKAGTRRTAITYTAAIRLFSQLRGSSAYGPMHRTATGQHGHRARSTCF